MVSAALLVVDFRLSVSLVTCEPVRFQKPQPLFGMNLATVLVKPRVVFVVALE